MQSVRLLFVKYVGKVQIDGTVQFIASITFIQSLRQHLIQNMTVK